MVIEGSGAASGPKVRKSAKAVGQVMTALKNSTNTAGPTMTDIVKFISSALFKPATKRQIVTALKRGVEFGILKRYKGHYLISSPDEAFQTVPVVPVMRKPGKTRKSKAVEKAKKRLMTRARQSCRRSPNNSYPRPPYELKDVFRNVECRASAVSSATTLYEPKSEPLDFEY